MIARRVVASDTFESCNPVVATIASVYSCAPIVASQARELS